MSSTDDNPCDLFERIDFPVDEFFPPERGEFLENGQEDPSVSQNDGSCGRHQEHDRCRDDDCDRDCRRGNDGDNCDRDRRRR